MFLGYSSKLRGLVSKGPGGWCDLVTLRGYDKPQVKRFAPLAWFYIFKVGPHGTLLGTGSDGVTRSDHPFNTRLTPNSVECVCPNTVKALRFDGEFFERFYQIDRSLKIERSS